MKKYFVMLLTISAVVFTACNNNKANNEKANADTSSANVSNSSDTTVSATTDNEPIKNIVASYLEIKNALANDNGNDAASGGKAMGTALSQLNTASFTDAQKKTFNDMQDDLKENAEHIGENANKIDHQREHFEMLSDDIYDMVKAFNPGQNLYKDYCPMYNNKKGAFWISETKEIKNPYLGKKMPTCGEVKEEIKQ